MTETERSLEATTKNAVEVLAKDLPLCCPTPSMTLWNMHPKVYLPIEETGTADCYFCGTHYVLVKESEE